MNVIKNFEKRGAEVVYFDPWIPKFKYHNGEEMEGLKELTADIIKSADIVVITAAHTNVDYDLVSENAKLIFDAKNAMKSIVKRDNIEVL